MEDVILGPYFGGLGDSLQFSTLPEEFYKQQGRVTYLVDGTTFRNKGIYDLVWGCNPYIKGIKVGRRNAGDIPEIKVENHTGNWISNWEHLHGLIPTNIRPKVYYEPKKLEGWEDKVLVDFSAITTNLEGKDYGNNQRGYDLTKVKDTYDEVRKNTDKRFVGIRFKEDVRSNKFYPPVDDTIVLEDIFHYCDLLNSVKEILCFFSGSMVLATAIQRYNPELKIKCVIPPSVYYNDRTQKTGIFYFDYVEYLVTNE